MYKSPILTFEHRSEALPDEELIALLRSGLPKLIESVDLKRGVMTTGYYIGLDRIPSSDRVLYVAPKFHAYSERTHYLSMLSSCLRHPDVLGHTEDLFEIDFNKPPISIAHDHDLITPLIVIQFLRSIKQIVQKGLQKGYYKVTTNRRSSIKGKILVSQTIRKNHFHQKHLETWCTYQEFGLNNPQNRLLKKALQFVERYNQIKGGGGLQLDAILRYIRPAFESVGVDFDPKEVGHFKSNPFFSEYKEAIRLAKLLLKRFGYHINAIRNERTTDVSPFWIDMSKLFELYVLGKLKEVLKPGEMIYQAKGEFGELDFLRRSVGKETIIDAKYKSDYARGRYDIDNIRQLSAYARDKGLLRQLPIEEKLWRDTVLDCLIIHPDKNAGIDLPQDLLITPIPQFERFFKMGIALPII